MIYLYPINRLKTRTSKGQNIPWLMYLRIAGRIKTDLRNNREPLRKMSGFEMLVQNQDGILRHLYALLL